MPILESCVVCGFRLPCVKRRDTRYCNRVCRARAHRARCLKRNPAIVRVHYTTLRRQLLAYWFVGLRHRCGMRPLKTEELVERLAQTLDQMEAAKHRVAVLMAQIAKLELGQHVENDSHRTELEALRGKLRAAEEDVACLQQELDKACQAVEVEVEKADPTAEQEHEEKGTPDPHAELLTSLQVRLDELAAENERLKASADAQRSSHEEALRIAQQKTTALESQQEVLKASAIWSQRIIETALRASEGTNALKTELASLKASTTAERGKYDAELRTAKEKTDALQAKIAQLKESSTAPSSSHAAELRAAQEKATALEQENTSLEMRRRTLTRELLQANGDLYDANQKLAQKDVLMTAAAKKIQSLQTQASIDLKLELDEDDDASKLRAELKRVKQRLQQTTQERDRALEKMVNHFAAEPHPDKGRSDAASQGQRAEQKQALAERDAARQDARNARAELQRKEAQFAEKARQPVEHLEQKRSSQNVMTVAAHRYEGQYHPSKDCLLHTMLDELLANADLARQQYIQSKPQTARMPHPHLTPAQQAHALAMAARWWLVASPPKSYAKEVSWSQDGYTLDADAELFLYKHSRDRSAEAWWQAFWLEPVASKRRGKRR